MMKPLTDYDTTTQEYIEIVFRLQKEDRVARVKDIAKERGVTASSASTAIKNLKKLNLVHHQKFGYVDLTKEGEKLGESLARRHKLLRFFLENVLGVDNDIAENDACLIEHVIAGQTFNKLLDFIEFMEKCPRGGPFWLQQFKQCQATGDGRIPCDNCPHELT